jgi:hypothetical protein
MEGGKFTPQEDRKALKLSQRIASDDPRLKEKVGWNLMVPPFVGLTGYDGDAPLSKWKIYFTSTRQPSAKPSQSTSNVLERIVTLEMRPANPSASQPTIRASRESSVRRPQVGERGEQIAVGSYLIFRHLPICEDS